jgi:uncharacterized protein involved in type VI secretion and phage assembly
MIADLDTDLIGMLRAVVRHELGRLAQTATGLVTAVHCNSGATSNANHECDLQLLGRELDCYRVPIAAGHIGSIAPLRVGELVLVQFIGGDANRPVVTGRLYGDDTRVGEHAEGEAWLRLPPDAADDERIDCKLDPANTSATLTLGNATTISASPGAATVSNGDLQISLDSDDGSVSLTTGSATLRLGDDGTLTIEADGDLSIEAQGCIKIKSAGGTEISSDAIVDVLGSAVNIN